MVSFFFGIKGCRQLDDRVCLLSTIACNEWRFPWKVFFFFFFLCEALQVARVRFFFFFFFSDGFCYDLMVAQLYGVFIVAEIVWVLTSLFGGFTNQC